MPSFARFIPAVYAYWNAVKGGSDTTTKLMDDRLLVIPYTNCETAATNRCLFILFALCHRLFQLCSAREDLDYPSLLHYRNAANKRYSFFQTLMKSKTIFQNEIKLIEELNNKENNANVPATHAQQRRQQPTRKVVDGALLQPVRFAPSLPTLTPKKISKRVKDGTASTDVLRMVQSCTGVPMKVYKTEGRQRCEICGAKTSWYCAGCKRFFCIDKKITDKLIDENKFAKQTNSPLLFDIYTHKVKGRDINFLKVCYHKAHEEAWCRPCDEE